MSVIPDRLKESNNTQRSGEASEEIRTNLVKRLRKFVEYRGEHIEHIM
jgi:hypothetical protein